MNKLRNDSIDFIERQENQYDQDTLPYYPTVQYTERLRQKVSEVILMSLTLDFLTSPLAADVDKIENTLKNTQEYHFAITPLSLWRAYPILTTVSYGSTELQLDNGFKIDFGDFLDGYKGEDKRVSQMINYIKQERSTFKTALETVWNDHQAVVKNASSSSAMFNCLQSNAAGAQDIERILFFTKGK